VRRRLLNLLTLLSMLLCAAVAALWVRSYRVTDQLLRSALEADGGLTYWTQDYLCVGRGGVGMGRVVQSFSVEPDFLRRTVARRTPDFHSTGPPVEPSIFPGVPGWSALGFRYYWFEVRQAAPRPTKAAWQLVVPLWAVLLPTAIPPAAWAWRWRRHRRRPGLCRSCGYDLRATPERCPECGSIRGAC
jgi:hypothetical protein